MIRPSTCLVVLMLALTGHPAAAQQGLFSPRIVVNGRAVTEFEYEQRVLMLSLFGVQGDVEAEARQGLIDDRLRMAEGKALGIRLSPEAIMAGMTEFAGRANLSAEEFVAALEQAGVAAETFRDFVEAGLVWREVVRARFVGRVTVSDKEVDRAIAAIQQTSALRVRLSEIVIPAAPGRESEARAVARRLQMQVRGEEAFARAAAQYSSGPTARSGGDIGWRTVGEMPEAQRLALVGLQAGQASAPVDVEGGVAIYLLREVEQGPPQPVAGLEVDYALVNLSYAADPVAEAERLRTRADACNDLNGLVPAAVPDSALTRATEPEARLAADIAGEIARLDPGEGGPVVRGGVPHYVMLCARNPILLTPVSRENVRNGLLNQKLAGMAEIYLEELRSQAIISGPGAAPAPGGDGPTD